MGGDSSKQTNADRSKQPNKESTKEPLEKQPSAANKRPESTKTNHTEQVQDMAPRVKYKRLKLLGEGTSGKVYECVDLATSQHYAMKVITLASKTKSEAVQEIQNLKREIALLKKLNHKNIVKYYSFDVSEDHQSVEIVLEKVTPGNLRDLVKKKPLTEQAAAKMCKEILHALKYMHEQGVIHRDLKGANILINEEGVPKISDFGTAKVINNKTIQDGIASKSKSLKGTPYWMAPEVLKRTGHTYSADIWSFGCTLIEMLTGLPPWSNISNRFEEIINYIASGIQPPFPPKISKICEKFLSCCLDTFPTKRLSADQLLSHPFIRDANAQDSIEEIDINLLEEYRPRKLQHSKNLRNQPKTQQTEPLPLVERNTQQAPSKSVQPQATVNEKTSRRKVSKMNKDKPSTRQVDSVGMLDYIQTKVSKKEKEQLQEKRHQKQAERREKAHQWELQLKRQAERLSFNK